MSLRIDRAVSHTHRVERLQEQRAATSSAVAESGDRFERTAKARFDFGQRGVHSAAADEAYVRSLYRDLLGREPDAEGLRSHLTGLARGMSRDDIRKVFLNSPEYQQKQVAQTATPSTGAGQTAGAEPGSDQAAKSNLGSTVGPVPLEGYNADKLANPDHKTVKYQFGRVASHFSLDGVKSKQDAEALLKRMQPELEAAGLKIHEIKGDKIRVETELGQEWVDVVRGAGGGNPGWWWGSEGKAIPGTAPGGSRPTSGGSGAGGVSGALSTVPDRPEYANANIDRSSPEAAARSAAQWAKDTYPELFGHGDDRQAAYEVMTHVIGALRAAGFDATRVVNHPSRAVGDPYRYGSDALVLGGNIYDVYGAFGDPGRSDVQALNQGPYAAGRLPE